MRHLVYLLLVANLAYLGWNVVQTRSTTGVVRQLPPLPENITHLVTLEELQELEDETEAGVSDIQELTQAEPPRAGIAVVCQSIGPFLAAKTKQEVADRLAELGLETTQRSADLKEPNGYWVYLPAMERAESRRIVRMLKKNNDKEYYVGKDYFISLGTFRGIARAEKRLKSARKLGLDPVLEPRYTTREVQWLDFSAQGAMVADLAGIAAEYPGLQLQGQVCE